MSSSLVLGPMLRHVGDTAATIWMETSGACEVEVLDAVTHTFAVGRHHYALVIVTSLEPGSTTEYEVRLDGERCWPEPDSEFPPSVIRTTGHTHPVRVIFGSCRAAAPHEPPYTLDADTDSRGRGVDALRANGLRMLGQPPQDWPDLLALTGDQVYADDTSLAAQRRTESRTGARADLPVHIVADFEEYTWLYEESWQPPVERWVFSVVPSVMIFDDHDMIDDWNISAEWVRDTQSQPWWQEHVIGGLTSYWIYQHLGNLSPAQIAAEGMFDELLSCADGEAGEAVMRRWAFDSDEDTALPDGYQFSFSRRIGDVRVVVVDCRNGRVLDPGRRRMVNNDEWAWVESACAEPCQHLLIVTSVPVFVPGGIHALQQWDEPVADGVWGAGPAWLAERMRRSIDLEDWPSFDLSFRRFEDMLVELGRADATPPPPATISVLSGDIHFAYTLELTPRDGPALHSRLHQLVSSPIRHVLPASKRNAMRFAESSSGRHLAEFLQRRVARPPSRLHWEFDRNPIFSNTMGQLRFDGPRASLDLERACQGDNGVPYLEVARHLDLRNE